MLSYLVVIELPVKASRATFLRVRARDLGFSPRRECTLGPVCSGIWGFPQGEKASSALYALLHGGGRHRNSRIGEITTGKSRRGDPSRIQFKPNQQERHHTKAERILSWAKPRRPPGLASVGPSYEFSFTPQTLRTRFTQTYFT
jgi:hypothetical protein